MSETELSVICKHCGSEVSPFVTECPYCGARLRKRAPKLERRGDALEARSTRRRRMRRPHLRIRGALAADPDRPYATLVVILGSAVLLLVGELSARTLSGFGGLVVPYQGEWWRFLSAPFAYSEVGYLFVVAVGLAIFGTALERRLGSLPSGILFLACGSLGMLAANAIAEAQGEVALIGGGNGIALGALAAWFALRRAETHRSIEEDYDLIGVAVAAAVLLALPLFEARADPFAGLVGGAVGGLAGVAASAFRGSG
jgi:membrane associated rhomboid family serine protease